jgi:hypothetical protein
MYSAENQLVKALPKVAEGAKNLKLKQLFAVSVGIMQQSSQKARLHRSRTFSRALQIGAELGLHTIPELLLNNGLVLSSIPGILVTDLSR